MVYLVGSKILSSCFLGPNQPGIFLTLNNIVRNCPKEAHVVILDSKYGSKGFLWGIINTSFTNLFSILIT